MIDVSTRSRERVGLRIVTPLARLAGGQGASPVVQPSGAFLPVALFAGSQGPSACPVSPLHPVSPWAIRQPRAATFACPAPLL